MVDFSCPFDMDNVETLDCFRRGRASARRGLGVARTGRVWGRMGEERASIRVWEDEGGKRWYWKGMGAWAGQVKFTRCHLASQNPPPTCLIQWGGTGPRPSERKIFLREGVIGPPQDLWEVPFCDLVFIASVPLGGFQRSSRRPSRQRKISSRRLSVLLPSSCWPLVLLSKEHQVSNPIPTTPLISALELRRLAKNVDYGSCLCLSDRNSWGHLSFQNSMSWRTVLMWTVHFISILGREGRIPCGTWKWRVTCYSDIL